MLILLNKTWPYWTTPMSGHCIGFFLCVCTISCNPCNIAISLLNPLPRAVAELWAQGDSSNIHQHPLHAYTHLGSEDTVLKDRLLENTNTFLGAFLVVQGLRIHLPMQGMWVLSLVRGTKIPHATEQLSPCATTTEPGSSGVCGPQLERSPRRNEDPSCHN